MLPMWHLLASEPRRQRRATYLYPHHFSLSLFGHSISPGMSRLRLSCPYGGGFFVCEHNTTEFIGCCTSDPRHDGKGVCPEPDLRSASFSPSSFAEIMPQDCNDDNSSWYTCNFTSPPFLGYCKTNPCAAPCSSADLTPAKLSGDVVARRAFLPGAQPGTNVAEPPPTSPESPGRNQHHQLKMTRSLCRLKKTLEGYQHRQLRVLL